MATPNARLGYAGTVFDHLLLINGKGAKRSRTFEEPSGNSGLNRKASAQATDCAAGLFVERLAAGSAKGHEVPLFEFASPCGAGGCKQS